MEGVNLNGGCWIVFLILVAICGWAIIEGIILLTEHIHWK